MDGTDALFEALRRVADPAAVAAIEEAVRDGPAEELARLNALSFAAERDLDEQGLIATLLHGARLGLFEMSWNVVCPSCGGVMDANATLKTVRQADYFCAFCDVSNEPRLDDMVEVSFTVTPRLRRIEAHEPNALAFWSYYRQIFFSSAVAFPSAVEFDDLARRCVIESVEMRPGERLILGLQLPHTSIILFEPVTHTAHYVDVEGEPTDERQELDLVFDDLRPAVGRSTLRPGPLRLSLENRSQYRTLPGVFAVGPDLDRLIGGRRPFLTAKRLLSNQTFRDIYRTETLAVDQRLKILSLTFLFTDLKGSTDLYERVGDLVAYDLVRAHFALLHDIVASEGGAVVKTIGDAVMATFPTPGQAVSAAMRMHDSMRMLNAERAADDLILKIGLHEGPCLAVSLNDRQDYFGQTVNIASRVQDMATADGVFATAPVVEHAAAADLSVTARPRSGELRGIGARMPVFELTAHGA